MIVHKSEVHLTTMNI